MTLLKVANILFSHRTNNSRMLFHHSTCAGQQPRPKPRPQEPVVVGFVSLTGAAQQDL